MCIYEKCLNRHIVVELLIENKKEIAESLLMKIQNKIDKDSKRKKARSKYEKNKLIKLNR